MNKKTKKKDGNLFGVRRGVVLIALLAVLVMVINLISASYSWFTPQSDTKQGMKYSFDGKIRSENCTMSTYTGIKVTESNRESGEYVDQLRYYTEPASGTMSISAGQTKYFKTEILNADTKNASDISLYIPSITGKFTLAVTYPGNTVRKFSSNQTDLYIVRDAYVKQKDEADVNGPGVLEIEWFITAQTATSFNVSDLYLLYN